MLFGNKVRLQLKPMMGSHYPVREIRGLEGSGKTTRLIELMISRINSNDSESKNVYHVLLSTSKLGMLRSYMDIHLDVKKNVICFNPELHEGTIYKRNDSDTRLVKRSMDLMDLIKISNEHQVHLYVDDLKVDKLIATLMIVDWEHTLSLTYTRAEKGMKLIEREFSIPTILGKTVLKNIRKDTITPTVFVISNDAPFYIYDNNAPTRDLSHYFIQGYQTKYEGG